MIAEPAAGDWCRGGPLLLPIRSSRNVDGAPGHLVPLLAHPAHGSRGVPGVHLSRQDERGTGPSGNAGAGDSREPDHSVSPQRA